MARWSVSESSKCFLLLHIGSDSFYFSYVGRNSIVQVICEEVLQNFFEISPGLIPQCRTCRATNDRSNHLYVYLLANSCQVHVSAPSTTSKWAQRWRDLAEHCPRDHHSPPFIRWAYATLTPQSLSHRLRFRSCWIDFSDYIDTPVKTNSPFRSWYAF
jgi:hypothetical protein